METTTTKTTEESRQFTFDFEVRLARKKGQPWRIQGSSARYSNRRQRSCLALPGTVDIPGTLRFTAAGVEFIPEH